MHKIFLLTCIIFLAGVAGNGLLAQTTDTTAAGIQQGSGSQDYIDLSGSAVRIKVEPDKPRVNIFSDRIRPEFDEVNLEKSFMPELLGHGEKIVLIDPERINNSDREIIDVNKIVERKR